MARRTIELKSSAASAAKTGSDVLVYKDAESDADMESSEGASGSDEAEYGAESSEEEIKEIPLDKRRLVEESDLDEYGALVDDSVSSSGDDSAGSDAPGAEEGEHFDYGSEEDDGEPDSRLASSGESAGSGDEDMDSEDLVK